MMNMTLNEILADALHSHYINDAYYAKLNADLTEWKRIGMPLTEQERQRYESVVLHENWLLDCQAFEDWYQLFTKECVYWIPSESTVNGHAEVDPQRHIAEAFDDRRRMADRIVWLRTGIASAQLPRSYTSHISSGFVRIPSDTPGEVKIRSQFVVHEIRGAHAVQTVCGWMGHVLVEMDGVMKIDRKLVALLDANRARHNPTYLI